MLSSQLSTFFVSASSSLSRSLFSSRRAFSPFPCSASFLIGVSVRHLHRSLSLPNSPFLYSMHLVSCHSPVHPHRSPRLLLALSQLVSRLHLASQSPVRLFHSRHPL